MSHPDRGRVLLMSSPITLETSSPQRVLSLETQPSPIPLPSLAHWHARSSLPRRGLKPQIQAQLCKAQGIS
eukprot:scaffold19350_cov10-Tisochrysis_lutea.AAC.1